VASTSSLTSPTKPRRRSTSLLRAGDEDALWGRWQGPLPEAGGWAYADLGGGVMLMSTSEA
jgi:hypothetical protein